jgi:spore germination protein GerM
MTDERPARQRLDPAITPTLPDTPAGRPPSRRVFWAAIAAGGALLGLVGWLVVSKLAPYLTTPDGAPTASEGSASAEGRRIAATLFYVTDDGSQLRAVSREVPFGASREEQALEIVAAQVQAAPAGQVSAIPAGTVVRAVFLTDTGQAYVDLGGTFATEHMGGSLNEALAVYAIVNALTTSLPDVTAVQILIDGKEVDTLGGHLDLRFPLAKSSDWIRKGQ